MCFLSCIIYTIIIGNDSHTIGILIEYYALIIMTIPICTSSSPLTAAEALHHLSIKIPTLISRGLTELLGEGVFEGSILEHCGTHAKILVLARSETAKGKES